MRIGVRYVRRYTVYPLVDIIAIRMVEQWFLYHPMSLVQLVYMAIQFLVEVVILPHQCMWLMAL